MPQLCNLQLELELESPGTSFLDTSLCGVKTHFVLHDLSDNRLASGSGNQEECNLQVSSSIDPSINQSMHQSMSQSSVRSVSQTSLGPVIKRCLLSSLVVLPYSYLIMMMMMMIIIMGLMMRNGCSNRFNYASATCAIMAPASASATAAAGRWAAHQAKRGEGTRRGGSIGTDRIFVPVGKLLQTSGKC